MNAWFVCKYCAIAIDKSKQWSHYYNHGLGAPLFEHFRATEQEPFEIVVRIPSK